MFASPSVEIERLARFLTDRAEGSGAKATLLIGAGASVASGVPTWEALCARIAERFRLPVNNGSSIEAVKHFLENEDLSSRRRVSAIGKHLSFNSPSIGYGHLANLLAMNIFDLVLTTNWDSLLEAALQNLVYPGRVKTFVRGETPDNIIAGYIADDNELIKIVKLHGDLISRILLFRDSETSSLDSSLSTAIKNRFRSELVIVGHSLDDPDVLALLTQDRDVGRISIHYANPIRPSQGSSASTMLRAHNSTVISGTSGDFDNFFIALDTSASKMVSEKMRDFRIAVHKDIIAKHEKGIGYINYERVAELVEDFGRKIQRRNPDLLVFVDDKEAPGGQEVRKRIERGILGHVPMLNVNIHGQDGNRVLHRMAEEVRVDKSSQRLSPEGPNHVVVIDAVAFSGNSLRLTCERVLETWPTASVTPAAMVVSSDLRKRSVGDKVLKGLIYILETQRNEINFPWGCIYSTSDILREVGFGDYARHVTAQRRPWGSCEIILDQEPCSVRILTIEPNERLSFHRHWLRDELFVALDEEVGLDFCGEHLDSSTHEFDPRIEALMLERGEYLLVPRGVWHRARAPHTRVRLLEVGFGLYDRINDVARLIDNYGRKDLDGSV